MRITRTARAVAHGTRGLRPGTDEVVKAKRTTVCYLECIEFLSGKVVHSISVCHKPARSSCFVTTCMRLRQQHVCLTFFVGSVDQHTLTSGTQLGYSVCSTSACPSLRPTHGDPRDARAEHASAFVKRKNSLRGASAATVENLTSN